MSQKTINMVIAALGGEGGGVLSNWLIDVADREGWMCQSTSLAGVAQRTGATIYYLELFPRSAITDGRLPVMSLFPAQGDIDIAVASEVAEAGRMVQRGFVTPDRTTLIASDHRVYGITEKQHLSDGIIDADRLRDVAQRYARNYVHYDMQALASEHNTVISAILFGTIAGAEVLPFSRGSFEATIQATGKAVKANLAAFEASYQRARQGGVETFEPVHVTPSQESGFQLPPARSGHGRELLSHIERFPSSCHEVLYQAVLKLVDYQDAAYAAQYLDMLQPVFEADSGDNDHDLTRETARYLVLWMCFEDIPRVAQFKTRATRMDKVREEVRAEPDQLFNVTEFFRPRVEEVCAMLPAGLGRRVQDSPICNRLIGMFSGGKRLRTNTVSVYVMLRLLAACRRWRRASLGYQHEHAMIRRWLDAVIGAASTDPALAREVAELGRLVKGYGDTRLRTTGQVGVMLTRLQGEAECSAETLRQWRESALADDEGEAFRRQLAA
ncbi:indolepyruvate oxidoreductase subunit beta family protein [Parahaliea mediterranea]|uniref:indolepyruvate oxidoreductase subunit beta family protein n=1 Tax=Parahaliea mediterranea TaxID=651086 RepID=UPI000E2E9E4B|nr:indolepyruvate oxidoreductase subunit beta family protein [Parahaliea mediterranea]